MVISSTDQKQSGKGLSLILFLAFLFCLGIVKFSFHEFWKDEWQAWFIATDTTSLAGLWKMLSVEGHPVLWFLVLRLAHGVSALIFPSLAPEYLIGIVHFLFVSGAAWFLFLRFRFHILIKIGLALSYFFFFEYGVVNRGYMLVIFLVFWLGTLVENPRQYRFLIPALLFLLCQTEVYGVLAALAVGFALFWEFDFKSIVTSLKERAGIILALTFGVGLFLVSMMPGGETQTVSAGGNNPLDMFTALYSNTLCIGLDPPNSQGGGVFSVLFSALLLILIVFAFRENKKWMFTFFCFSMMFILFGSFIYKGGPRQWGIHFAFFVLILNFIPVKKDQVKQLYAYIALLVLIILAQVIHAGKIISKEKKFLFSNAIEAGRFIRKNIPEGTAIIGINKAYCTPVIGYARHKFYSLPDKQLFSYALFREKLYLPSMEDILNFYREKEGGGELFILSYRPLPSGNFRNLELIQEFNKPSIREESYFLYRLTPNKQ